MKYNFESINKRYHAGSNKWNELERNGLTEKDDIIPFSVADMELENAPEIREALKNKIDTCVLGYSTLMDSYRKVVCEWMKERRGWNAQPEWIIPEHGIIDAFHHCVKIFTQPGDGVMLMTPVYYPMYHAIRINHRVLVDNPLKNCGDHYEIDFEDFEKKAADANTKMLILCSPHNPCSRVWKKEELEKIADICNRNHVLVVSDEIHSDLIMPGYTHIVYASLNKETEQNCIICTAPSKTFNLAGLQTSNVFVPNEKLRNQYIDAMHTSDPTLRCNVLGYTASEAAYLHCGEWLDECIQVIDENRRLVVDFLAKEFPQIKVTKLEATYLLWMDWRGLGIDYKELERINHEEARLFFDEGYVFGEQGEGFERWNLACPTRYVREGLERMKAVYSKYVK